LLRVNGLTVLRLCSWSLLPIIAKYAANIIPSSRGAAVGRPGSGQTGQWKMGLASKASFSNGAKPGAVMLSGAFSCQLHQLNITVPHIENPACCSAGQPS